jgi:hypothetical protein
MSEEEQLQDTAAPKSKEPVRMSNTVKETEQIRADTILVYILKTGYTEDAV